MPSVIFCNRYYAENLTEPSVMISIGDVGQELNLAIQPRQLLRLEFDDVEDDLGPAYRLFDHRDALKILRFVDLNKDEDIIVHCEAGISRSAAVAKFLKDHWGYKAGKVAQCSDNDSCYNTLVYRQLQLVASIEYPGGKQ